ncbi:MAG: M56 family metallopeptidase [Pseudomonadota bacterium]
MTGSDEWMATVSLSLFHSVWILLLGAGILRLAQSKLALLPVSQRNLAYKGGLFGSVGLSGIFGWHAVWANKDPKAFLPSSDHFPSDQSDFASAPAPLIDLSWQFEPEIVLVLWSIGAAVIALRNLCAMRKVADLRDRAHEAPPELQKQIDEIRRRFGIFPAVSVRVSDKISSPCACGILRPAILLPLRMLDSFDFEKTVIVCRHEMAHIAHGDIAMLHAEAVLRCLLWFNPGLPPLLSSLSDLRERAADERAARDGGERRLLAEALASLALEDRRHKSLAFVAGSTSGAFEERLRRLLNLPGRKVAATLQRVKMVGLLLLGTGMFGVAATASPAIEEARSVVTLAETARRDPQQPPMAYENVSSGDEEAAPTNTGGVSTVMTSFADTGSPAQNVVSVDEAASATSTTGTALAVPPSPPIRKDFDAMYELAERAFDEAEVVFDQAERAFDRGENVRARELQRQAESAHGHAEALHEEAEAAERLAIG